jgi:hypothetical protein
MVKEKTVYIVTCRGYVTCRRGLDYVIGCIDTLYTVTGTTGNCSAITISTFYSSLLHPLVFLVFTSRILATDLYQSHCHFKSRMKSSLHSLISLLPLFPITFDCRLSQFSPATANSGTRLNSNSNQSHSYFTTSGFPQMSLSWGQAP